MLMLNIAADIPVAALNTDSPTVPILTLDIVPAILEAKNPFLLTLNQLNKNKIQLNYNNEILGKCEIVVSSSIVNCVDNHTELQSKLREDTFTGITTRFVAGEFCVVLATEFDSNKDKNLISTLVTENFNLKNQNIKNRTIDTQDTNLLSKTNLISTLFSN